jgi:outer membrane protein OmpA-like peptidoglycan-associated protein
MNESSSESLSASFTDLMTSLAVIFILLLVAATNSTVHRFQQVKRKTATDRQALIKRLQVAFPNLDVKADPNDPLGVIIVVPQGLLNFVIDKAVIPEPGQKFLQNFIPALAGVVCTVPHMVRSIVIEGYTDASGTDLINVRLSQDRATSVAMATLNILTGRDPGDYSCFLGMMSASGRGKNDLVYVNGQPDPGESRRVEFHLRVPSFEQRSVQESISQATKGRAQLNSSDE